MSINTMLLILKVGSPLSNVDIKPLTPLKGKTRTLNSEETGATSQNSLPSGKTQSGEFRSKS